MTEEESRHEQRAKILERCKHVEFEPKEKVEAENAAEARMKADHPNWIRQIADAEANFKPLKLYKCFTPKIESLENVRRPEELQVVQRRELRTN